MYYSNYPADRGIPNATRKMRREKLLSPSSHFSCSANRHLCQQGIQHFKLISSPKLDDALNRQQYVKNIKLFPFVLLTFPTTEESCGYKSLPCSLLVSFMSRDDLFDQTYYFMKDGHKSDRIVFHIRLQQLTCFTNLTVTFCFLVFGQISDVTWTGYGLFECSRITQVALVDVILVFQIMSFLITAVGIK